MTSTDVTRSASRNGADDKTEVHYLAQTETRRSTRTSEMWLAVATFATIVAAGYFSDALSVDRAWLFATIVMTGYIVSRGIAKAGSRELDERAVDLRR